jgi:hypothetical protein
MSDIEKSEDQVEAPADAGSPEEYGAGSIKVLKGLEAVR